ncbi:beta-ketoacyl-acyl carrier protein reductase [[Clostridium] ultunense Esp]|uniref:3-oxoacyl-[acyl-carrier-protein] reductase n=1 Tax=Thermicanus aegyptius TaxID=94009 RepID=UPI0002B6FA82|nr:3-oxoacyl-[acyl-carrier-protein] reductase [Thermicanus aegyptius]CCQ92368.1 beta-ketoacyl-acyl carrier protein reductase [[Clostridium] ultunense Esp]
MLKGRVALITGASRGIGRATALALAEAGAKIAVNFQGNEERAREVVHQVESLGGEALLVKADVSRYDQVESMVDAVLSRFGKLDILVNNAGITRDTLIMRMKEEDWDAVINTNLKGVFHCIKAVTRPMMKQRYGRIINLSSVVGISGNPGQANYVAAKAGVIGLTKTAAKELASRGITVNAVAPGFIETDMTGVLDEKLKEELLKMIPLARFGKPEDVARVIRFLATSDAEYITGQVIHVDGGMVM